MQLDDLLLAARGPAQLADGTARPIGCSELAAADAVAMPSLQRWEVVSKRRRRALAGWACAAAAPLATDMAGWRCPALGETLAVADVVIPAVIAFIFLAAILRGTAETCERAFRLLRWITNRPEPPAPKPVAPHWGPPGSESNESGQ